jgi:hypothetical protein
VDYFRFSIEMTSDRSQSLGLSGFWRILRTVFDGTVDADLDVLNDLGIRKSLLSRAPFWQESVEPVAPKKFRNVLQPVLTLSGL